MARKSTRVNSGLGGRPNRDVRHTSGLIKQEQPQEEIITDEENSDVVYNSIVSTLETNASNISTWLEKVGGDDPLKALTIYLQLLEYHTPKKQRVDTKRDESNQVVVELENIEMYKNRKETNKKNYGADFPE